MIRPLVYKGEVIRFKANRVVEAMHRSRLDLNQLSLLEFPQEDWDEFYQLIGYSVCGYCDLDTSEASKDEAWEAMTKLQGGGWRALTGEEEN